MVTGVAFLLLLSLFSFPNAAQYSKIASGQSLCFSESTHFSGEPLIIAYTVAGEAWAAGVSQMIVQVEETRSGSVFHREVAENSEHVTIVPTPIAGQFKICLEFYGCNGRTIGCTADVEVDVVSGFNRLPPAEELAAALSDDLDVCYDLAQNIEGLTLAAENNVKSLVAWHEDYLSSMSICTYIWIVAFTVANGLVVVVTALWQTRQLKRLFVEKKLV